MKAAFVISFLPNPRMIRRITLAQTFCESVKLICINRGNNMQEEPHIENVDITIINKNIGTSLASRILSMSKLRSRILSELKNHDPDIVHVQGIDMLDIAVSYKKKCPKTKILYEVADLHALLVDKQSTI